jgi:hypothetical protein
MESDAAKSRKHPRDAAPKDSEGSSRKSPDKDEGAEELQKVPIRFKNCNDAGRKKRALRKANETYHENSPLKHY